MLTEQRSRTSRQRTAGRSAVTWNAAEQQLLDQLRERMGLTKDARLLRRLLIERARAEGFDTRAAELALAGPARAREDAA